MKQIIITITLATILIVSFLSYLNHQQEVKKAKEFEMKYRPKSALSEVVKGIIKDDNGVPLKNVRLILKGSDIHITNTDEDGMYFIPNIEEGDYEITCMMEGSNDGISKKVHIRNGMNNKHNFIYYGSTNSGFAHTKLGF
ncbi:MAG: carboxypeptidase regulatory-like domain-containing protein [Candidatus Delongbacteria bacterium]|nr:carboxypeptidase regulatory-like domain-containing protein [Candidatus Delongbacteria bacterium]MBN2836838.1 carboxypeptidase regulatory-like domain-containing protein [Candidatus Delongbacteria bacterium]